MLDVGGWWLARWSGVFVPVVAGAGATYALALALAALLVLADLWFPRRDG